MEANSIDIENVRARTVGCIPGDEDVPGVEVRVMCA